MPVTQFDMKYVEGAGLVKFDFLGLKTLSVLREAVRLLERRGITIDLDTLAWDDPEVYALLQRGDTVGVFQLESEGMRRTLAAVKPSNFGDIIALVSLYRPGPMDNIPSFGARKNGREAIAYPHPLLEGILAETYGIFVYQEQVMQAAQILAGYSLGQADILRRAMGKKDKAGMEKQRAGFVAGCASQGIEAPKANELFDLIDKFAGYGFNKSHAAAYALLAYHTAWLKVHYPHEFFAASMSFDIDQTDKLSVFVDDMRRMGVALAPPCINTSEAAFAVESVGEDWQVRYSLGALKSVGERAMEQLVAERAENGLFRNLDDFAGRVDPRLLNRRQIEALAASGALDAIVPDRAAAHAGAELVLAVASSSAGQRMSGQGGLFGGDVLTAPHVQLPRVKSWPLAERMAKEKEAFGFYFSAHPVERFAAVTVAAKARSFGDYATGSPAPPGERRAGILAAMVETVRWRTSQRGNRYMLAGLSDRSGQFQASCFDDGACAALEIIAEKGDCALLYVEMDWREGEETPRVAIRSVQSLDRLMAAGALRLSIAVDNDAVLDALPAMVPPRSADVRGEIRLILSEAGRALGDVVLGSDFVLDQDIAQRLETIDGVGQITFELLPDRARPRNET
jgi:DNA polymerase-3 subunit alpha